MDNDHEEGLNREPPMKARLNPELYILEKSEKEQAIEIAKVNGRCPRNEPYAYQDLSNLAYPFFIDAAQLIFIGRVCEEPVSASFTIMNPVNMPFWYKIKTSSREMFKIRKPVGKLERDQSVTISVIFYPGFKRPKAYCEYIHVYSMGDDDRDNNPFEAFGRLDRHHRPMKKRIYMDFIWHPHIEMTRAFENGHLLEMRKSKNEHEKNNVKKAKRAKLLKIEDFMNDLNLYDVTHKHRKHILEKQIDHDVQEKHRLQFMNSDEMDKYITEMAANKNRNKVAVTVMEPLKNYDRQYDYLERKDSDERQFALWAEYTAEAKKKGYTIPDKQLVKTTLQQNARFRQKRKNQKEREEALKGLTTPTGATTPGKSPKILSKGTPVRSPKASKEKK